MERVTDYKYIVKYTKHNELENLGFFQRHNRYDEKIYKYRFPVYKHNGHTLLCCILTIKNDSNTVVIDVYDTSHHCKYRPFYSHEYGNHECILYKINRKIKKELKKLGAIKCQKR